MSSRDAVLVFSIWFLLTVVQLLTALVSPWVAIGGGVLVALLLPALLRFFGIELESFWATTLIALAASAAGVLAAAIA